MAKYKLWLKKDATIQTLPLGTMIINYNTNTKVVTLKNVNSINTIDKSITGNVTIKPLGDFHNPNDGVQGFLSYSQYKTTFNKLLSDGNHGNQGFTSYLGNYYNVNI